jgi:hypothetical protein
MSTADTVFDTDIVEEIITACRNHIDREPEDTVTRLRLAWCLIAWALYQCGQEVTKSHYFPNDQIHINKNKDNKNSQNLIDNGIRQAMIVSALTTKPEERKHAENLLNLVSMFNDKNIIKKYKDENNLILEEIIWNMNKK